MRMPNDIQDELQKKKKGMSLPELIVTLFMACFIIFIFVKIVFL
jgi:hypothetical protein